MQDNIVLLTFEQPSKAYQALSELKQAAAQGRVRLQTAAVVERDAAGALQVRDAFNDGAAGEAPLVGTVLGSLLGVLGGPLGVLMVGATGAWLGSLAAMDTVARRASLLEQMTHALPAGATAVLAHVEESAVEVVDGLAQTLCAVVLRRPTDALFAEVEAAGEAQDAAAEEARKVLRAKQRTEWQEKFDNWTDEVGERLTALKDQLKARIDGHK